MSNEISNVSLPSTEAAYGPVGASSFGTTADGRAAHLFTLSNDSGASAEITDFGGTVVRLLVPDRTGGVGDVVLGFDTLAEYERTRIFLGALIGRYANRIANGRFRLGDAEYQLAVNNGRNHLHGGERGFDRMMWDASPAADRAELEIKYLSRDGEEGYPGELAVSVIYKLTDDNALVIEYSAETDRETVVNLTNHSYFNLAGGGTILGHELMINADRFTPTDDSSIPHGPPAAVPGTPFDFRTARPIGERINDPDQQLEFGKGYDHNWVLRGPGGKLELAADIYEPVSGRRMEMWTTEPGVQFYSGNFLDGSVTGKGGTAYGFRSALCLEAQHFPDSPNRPDFPPVVLRPGDIYSQTTIYKFSTN
jgi:aldose 1-epimerase